MDMKGQQRIAAPKQETWEALFDPEVLRQCIPGCRSVERLSDVQFKANVELKIGPVKAKFAGDAELSEIDAPNNCKLTGKGSGGVAGFGKGEAWIRLAVDGDGTLLTYEAKASVGGKLAQLGQRLIDSTAKKLADEFFTAFETLLAERNSTSRPVPVPSEPEPIAKERTQPDRIRWLPFAAGSAVLVVGALILIFA